MATYKDADFKKVYKTQIDTLNKKVKAFNTALSGNELEILQGLSAMVDEHWGRWAEDLAKIRLSTTDPYAITGTLRPSARFSPIRKRMSSPRKSAWVTALMKPAVSHVCARP